MMNAVIYERYGPPEVLKQARVTKPKPGDDDLLIRVKASTVTSGTIWMRLGKFPGSTIFTVLIRLINGINKPRKSILGYEFSGVVEEVGKNVQGFKMGDEVYGTTTGLKQGAYADYIRVPEKWKMGVITHKPKELYFEEAAALPVGGMTALQLLQKTSIQPHDKVLIYGASGSVGTYAVQIAKYFGAEVTGVCSTANLEMVRSIGADHVIDYTGEDIGHYKGKFDVVFDAVGKVKPSLLKTLLNDKGRYASVRSMTSEKVEYLRQLHQMISEGKLKPVLDRVYPIKEIVEAHRYVEQGHKRGNVVASL